MKIILHTAEHCPRCKVLKEKLGALNIRHEENTDTEVMVSMGIKTVPVLEISGKLMEFSEAVKWLGGAPDEHTY